MYVRVPAINGVPQVGQTRLILGISVSENEAICEIVGELQEGWTEITQADFEAICPPIPVIEEPPQPTMVELKENQLILMDAVATLFETIIDEPI